jgi:hypothetical protein
MHLTVAKNTMHSLIIYCGLEQCIFFDNFHFGPRTFILHDLTILSPN